MRLEDTKASGYGNHNEAYIVGPTIGNCNIQNGLPHPNGLTSCNSTEILYSHLWCDDPPNEIQFF